MVEESKGAVWPGRVSLRGWSSALAVMVCTSGMKFATSCWSCVAALLTFQCS